MGVALNRIARDIAFTLEVKSAKIFDNIFLKNGCLFLFGANGRVRVRRGGDEFHERTHLGQNSNVGHRDKHTVIPITFQNNFKTAKYAQAVVSGAVPINFVEEDQNMDEHRISDMADALIEELMNTFPNKVADGIMKATSTGVDPTSIREELQATNFGSQTRTTGGISRGDYTGSSDETQAWQTRYNNTAADLSGAAGIATATKFLWECSDGASLNLQPDLFLTTNGVFAKASAAADVLRRWGVNDTMIKYGFTNIKINNAALIVDRNAAAKAGYVVNTNFARIQVLGGRNTKKTGDLKLIGDGASSVPLQVRPPVESDNYLNYVIKAYLVYNLTFGGLKQHGLMANLTEA